MLRVKDRASPAMLGDLNLSGLRSPAPTRFMTMLLIAKAELALGTSQVSHYGSSRLRGPFPLLLALRGELSDPIHPQGHVKSARVSLIYQQANASLNISPA